MEKTVKANKKKKNPALRILEILFYVIIGFILIIGIIGIVGKFKGKGKGLGLFGFNFYVVATGSMENVSEKYADFLEGHNDRIKKGDLIITRKIKKNEKPKVYDVVTFIQGGKVVVHRVVDVQTSDAGMNWYTTRGDSNSTSDGQRTIDEFTGILLKDAGQTLGTIVKFIQSYYGIAAVAGAIAIILVAILVNDSLKKKEEQKEAEEARIAEMKAAQARKAAVTAPQPLPQAANQGRTGQAQGGRTAPVQNQTGTRPSAPQQGIPTRQAPGATRQPTASSQVNRPSGAQNTAQSQKPAPKPKARTAEEAEMDRLFGDFTWSMPDDTDEEDS